ncbi:MMPL family transporter [Pyxidicoccus fallax]|uniref:MMPL family transporter n=1 Tax=Pyxidicoccus fallax TaxID=394095 RepID=A0A848LSK7_9BACT|nr:efflux RND transporter permease subunit [Pyxidicoccus fallax]NMO20671.1 MMPL family transporter [Pyxidicoccus fallax]NPC84302.1 MMPL family transporter [Pyxidicoccus fallax]
MALTDIFVRRPVLAIVVNLFVVIGGLQAIRTLSVRQYPKVESATVTIRTVYLGASADLVRGFITTPIERAVAAAGGIDYIESQSVQGLSTINVRLKLNFNAADALADISSRVNQVRTDLPPEAEVPSIQIEPSDAAVAAMYLSFGSDILDDNQVTDYLIRIVQPRLSAIDGVQRADLLGGRTFALRAWLKPERLAAFNVSPSEVRQALASNNALTAVGQTKGALVQANITATTDLRSADQFKKLIVRERNGAVVRLEDVADVVLGAESYDEAVRFSGERAVFMGIWVLPTANSLDVIRSVREEMELVRRELPSGMQAHIAYDATTYIDDALNEVLKTLSETILIVILVILLFLGSLRTSLVPVIAIPLSLVGGVFLMQLLGFTLNLLTLLAIVLSVGLVVDDAIVVVENVERRVRLGETPLKAALLGARELVRPLIAITITLAAVYAPIGLQGGLSGALFREFAFTLAGAVFVSGFVALTLSPMMSSKLIRPEHGRGRVGELLDRGFEAVRRGYLRALDATLGLRPAVYAVWILLSLLVVPMYLFAPKELAPLEDQGVVFGAIEAPANASLEQVSFYTDQVHAHFKSTPEFMHSFQITFPSGGFGGMLVKPWTERERTVFDMEAELNQKLATVTGIRAPVFLPPSLPSAGQFPVEFVIASTREHEELVRLGDQIVQEAVASGQFAFPPIVDVRIDQARHEVVIDRDKAAALGLTMQQVGADLSALLSGDYVNRFNLEGRSYKVIPQVERAARLDESQLADLRVRGPKGELLPLRSIATLQRDIEPRTLNRFQQLNSIKISGVFTRSLDGALSVLEDSAARLLPEGFRVDYTGEARQLREEAGRFLPAMGLALVLIFLVLAAQFNSFRDPFVILAGSVPLSMFGALIFLFLKFQGPPGLRFSLTEGWTTTLNIYSQVGLVTLVGLIAKNGILMVEFANVQQLAGLGKLEAIREAARIRFRPILMTTAATVAGHLPLTFASGPGAEARNSIGYVLVGGMSIGTLFTLFVVPSLYMLIARQHRAERELPEGEALSAPSHA